MKLCKKCGIEKSLEEFHNDSHRPDGKQYWCIACRKELDKALYKQNGYKYTETRRKRAKEKVFERRTQLWEYFKSHPCVDCGETDPVVLHSDHIGKKSFCVSHLISRKAAWSTVLKELQECETRCANCHLRRTSKQFNWSLPVH